jgi:hypothetical protein
VQHDRGYGKADAERHQDSNIEFGPKSHRFQFRYGILRKLPCPDASLISRVLRRCGGQFTYGQKPRKGCG